MNRCDRMKVFTKHELNGKHTAATKMYVFFCLKDSLALAGSSSMIYDLTLICRPDRKFCNPTELMWIVFLRLQPFLMSALSEVKPTKDKD